MIRFALTTLGCKVNQYDGRAVASALSRRGLRPVRRGEPPDLVVINTCCVTAEAMRKSRQAIRRAVRSAQRPAVLVLGCYGDYDAARIRELLRSLSVPPNRAMVLGHHDDLADRIDEFLSSLSARELPAEQAFCVEGPAQACQGRYEVRMNPGGLPGRAEPDLTPSIRGNPSAPVKRGARAAAAPPDARRAALIAARADAVRRSARGTRDLGPIDGFPARQRACVKVQDGCDAFCAYCVVPYTRACLWSRPIAKIVDECRRLVARGHREIVLSGVFLGAYGRRTAVRRRWAGQPSKLPELVRAVAGIGGLWRVRLSSLEPGDLDAPLLATFAELDNVAPHLHLPLQSGSATILRRMNRQYTVEQVRRAIDRARSALDRPAVTTDIIVGFPGESDEDFARTLTVARWAGFAKIHAFRFSAIEGTAAWAMRRDAPPGRIVRARMAELAAVERQTARAFRRQFVGEAMEALVESARPADRGRRRAMTDRYVTVFFDPPGGRERQNLTGQVVRLRIREVTEAGLRGELVREAAAGR